MLNISSIKKLYTNNPFIDSVLYFTKYLAYGSVVKFEKEAIANETVKSYKEGDIYITSVEGKGMFEIYEYTEDDMKSVGILNPDTLASYMKNNSIIPDAYKEKLLVIGRQKFIDNYEEYNNYYRMLMGLPNIGEYGIPIKNYEYLIPAGNQYTGTFVHELGYEACRMLDSYGILDQIKADYPDAKYLDYCTCGITAYKARKSYDFQLLYRPSTGIEEIDERFDARYRINRDYVINNIYSDAMKTQSDYYDNFIGLMIMLMTMVDIISYTQDDIIKRDILDARCIEFIFEQYGIPYFHSIPLMFQLKMVKQINTLVRTKSCMEEMLNFIKLFGCEDIQIFKYYLLKDRVTDVYGNYLYNLSDTVSSVDNRVILTSTSTVDISNTVIPFPFDYYLQKGNVMFVFLDDVRINVSDDYQVYNYNNIRFLNGINSNKSKIRYIFYYDKSTVNSEYSPDTTDAIKMIRESVTATSNTIKLSSILTDTYFTNNDTLITVNDYIVDSGYTYDSTNKELTFDNSITCNGKVVRLLYLTSDSCTVYYKKIFSTVYVSNQKRFAIPVPFKNYVINGNGFFITFKGDLIPSSKYTIENYETILLDNSISTSINDKLCFNMIYSDHSIYAPIDIMHSEIDVTATQYFQYIFPITYPIKKYLEYGYKVYIELRGWYLSEDYYDVYTDKIQFRDLAVALHPGDTMKIHFVYGPAQENIIVGHTYAKATYNYQSVFDIEMPMQNFFTKGNKLFIDSDGYLLAESDYTLSSDLTKITITNKDLTPLKDQKVNYTFVYNKESDQAIKITEQHLTASSNQKVFLLDYPCYPYFETGQGIVASNNGNIIPNDTITANKFNITLTTGVSGVLDILYVYNNKYILDISKMITIKEVSVATNFTSDSEYYIDIPKPFDDYIENNWPLFVEGNGKYLDTSLYDIINSSLMFATPKNITNYSKFKFVFVYKNYYPYIQTTTTEDFTKDAKLRFVRIKLDNMQPIEDLKNKKAYRDYDAVTLSDKFWDGEDNDDNLYHEKLKKIILNREFNYSRTKYMTLDYMIDLSEMSFEIPYFFNMLYDDVYAEDLLTVQVKSISPNKYFKLANLFIYMTALAYNYSGIADTILDTPTKVMWVKGFNFHADLTTLKEWITDQRKLYTDYDVFDFLFPNGEIADFTEFTKIYTTNKNIWKTIVHGMKEARNYDVYTIWKKLYDSLMVWKFNKDFFKLNDGKIADTFTQYLEEKDYTLYSSLRDITQIEDNETRLNAIVTNISDIVYVLKEYLDTTLFKYIYINYPGVSGEYIIQYLFTMINFFKSYKVILHETNIDLNFDDPNTGVIRFHDITNRTNMLDKLDYIHLDERKVSKLITLHDKDTIGFKDKINISYSYI